MPDGGCDSVEQDKRVMEKMGVVSDSGQSSGLVELLQELMNASAPYLRRKKMTPRHECSELNRVWAKCAKHLEKQNDTNEPQGER